MTSCINTVRGLKYYGGKSPIRSIGRWISSILGFNAQNSYVEPFAGMLGVLLCRPAVKVELVNDTNSDLVNWWQCVRDRPDELAQLVACTPWSHEEFNTARRDVLSGTIDDPLRHAMAFHVVIEQSMTHGAHSGWSVTCSSKVGSRARWTGEEFFPLAHRLRDVQIENRCALEILDRMAREKNTTIYCDPPYRSSDTSPYGKVDINWNDLADLLQCQMGQVAISGYGDEWDCLGWRRFEKHTQHRPIGKHASRPGATASDRTEVLWINFEPAQMEIWPY